MPAGLVFMVRKLGSSDNLPVVERRVLPQDSGGQQGELLQIRFGRVHAAKKKHFVSNFGRDPAVLVVLVLSASGPVKEKVDVYMRS